VTLIAPHQASTWLDNHRDDLGEGSPGELQQAFRHQLQDAAAAGCRATDWKAKVKYTVFLGSAEFITQMRKLLRGDRDQQSAECGIKPGKSFYLLVAAVRARRHCSLQELRDN